jgi:hypothetical protein
MREVPFSAVHGMGSPTSRGAPRDSDEREGLPDCLCIYLMSVDPPRRLTKVSLLRSSAAVSRAVLDGAASRIVLLQEDEVISLDDGQGSAHGCLGRTSSEGYSVGSFGLGRRHPLPERRDGQGTGQAV